MPSYSPDECAKKLKEAGVTPCSQVPHLEHHCTNVNIDTNSWCLKHEKGEYYPYHTVACALKEGEEIKEYRYFPEEEVYDKCHELKESSGKPWTQVFCDCCCSCFAYGTPVATPGGHRSIESLATGEQVLAAAPHGSSSDLSWRPVQVTFSEGVSGGTSHNMVYLTYGPQQGPGGELVCSSDQVIMLHDGKLVRASQLHHGDRLVDKDGDPVEIRVISIGDLHGGVHHIGTSSPDDLRAEHLLIAGGIVAGDYYLQLNFDALPDEHKVDDLQERPHLWSSEYAAQDNAGQRHQYRMVFGDQMDEKSAATVQVPAGEFVSYSHRPAQLGDTVAAFLTPAQAADVLKNGHQISPGNPIPHYTVINIFKKLAGFYPDIEFYLDWYNPLPNVYAVSQYDRKFVVITGGLARLKELPYQGLTMAIAHGVQRFSKHESTNADGFSTTGLSDYLAFAFTSREIWWSVQELEACLALACEQMLTLFGLITPPNTDADPTDPLDQPSVDCRIQCVTSGFAAARLPECAGGPVRTRVALEDAVAPNATTIILTTNVLVTEESTVDVSHYTLTPAATITAAVRGLEERPHHLKLTADLTAGQTYQIKINGLVGEAEHTGVDLAHDTRQFTVPS